MTSIAGKGVAEHLGQDEKARADHACTACHRRKLKCDRELPPQGCSTCRKADTPCMYTDPASNGKVHATTRAGRKKARGPYRKGQTPREKELENYVLLLTKKCSDLESRSQFETQGPDTFISDVRLHDFRHATTSSETQSITHRTPLSPYSLESQNYLLPKPALILELWLRFVSAIDPFLKLIHCPTVSQVILSAKEQPTSQPPDIEALMLSIYIASLNSLNIDEIHTELGADKEDLIATYRIALEQLLLRADSNPESLTLTFLQAALIHLGSLRRQAGDDTSLNIAALFELIVRLAHHLRVDDAAIYSSLTPFEAEYRRRAWWTICRYRSAYAEDFAKGCVLTGCAEIAFPSNYNDSDLDPWMSTYPVPRNGLSDLSIMRMQFKIVKLLTSLVIPNSETHAEEEVVYRRNQHLVNETRTEIEQETLTRCDASRPFDGLILLSGKVLLTKMEITLLESRYKSGLEPDLNAFHDLKVPLALDIIESHQQIISEPRLQRWQWYWKHSHQWHSTIYVLEEVARRPEASFAGRVWEAINSVLTSPNILDKHGMNIETRTKLLDSHEHALQAREQLMRARTNLHSRSCQI